MGAKGKLRIVNGGHAAYCPGCEEYHIVYSGWQFDGNYNAPTFTPSLRVTGYSENFERDFVCHSFITNGEWHFLGDCTHDLKNTKAPLRDEEYEEAEWTGCNGCGECNCSIANF